MEQENITIPVDEFKKVIELFKEATNQLKDNSERLKRIEEEIGLTEEAQKAKQERINLAKLKLAEYKQKLAEESNAIYPLTPCGVIPYPIGAKTGNLLPLDANPDLPNQEDAFPLIFSLPLDGDVGKIVEESMMNDCLYTASVAATWFTTGQQPTWSKTVVDKCGGYNKAAVVCVFSGLNEYTYYKSTVDRNTSTIQEGIANGNWVLLYRILPNEDHTIIQLFNNKNSNIIGAITAEGVSFGNYDTNSSVQISSQQILMGDYGRTSLYPKLVINKNSLTWFNGNGTDASNILGFFSSDGSQAQFFQDIHMQYKIGYRQIIYDQNPRAVLYYLSGGLVIFSGIVATNSDGLIDFNIPTLKTLTNLTGANQVPVYCSIIQDSSSPNHDLSVVAELSTDNTKITGKSYQTTTGAGRNAYVGILVIGILADYVGDELAKIRAYKSSFYYDDLSEDRKLELRQYYIALDETKDLTKVTAPKWLEAELAGKELA